MENKDNLIMENKDDLTMENKDNLTMENNATLDPNQIEDAEIVEEKITRKRPYILVRRFGIDEPTDTNKDSETLEQEGLQIWLPEDGYLSPEMVDAMIAEMYVSKLPDNRSITVTARLRNNFLLHETYASPTMDSFDEKSSIEICTARLKQRIWDNLIFLWSCASVKNSDIKKEIESRQALFATQQN